MEGGASERNALIRQQIPVLEPRRFEQLVLALVEVHHPTAQSVEAPDGGADVLVPAINSTPAVVWQAKRYPKDMAWDKCERSLVDAIDHWAPSTITFVFARNLSKHLQREFETRLVKHRRAVEESVEVRQWNLDGLVSRLEANPELIPRFFGENLELHLEKLDRTVKAGGKLESAGDLVERAATIGRFAEQQDADFRHSTVVGNEAPDWPNLPYMTVVVNRDGERIEVAAWVREGADVPQPMFRFTDDDVGREARARAVSALAKGEGAELTEGFDLAVKAPKIMQELAPPGFAFRSGTFTLAPGDAVPLEVEVEFDGQTLARTVEMRPVPPPGGAAAAFAGYVGTVLAELSFTLLDKPAIRLAFRMSGTLEGSATERAEAAELLYAFHAHAKVMLRSEQFFSVSGTMSAAFELDGDVKLEELAFMRELFSDIAYIEERLGIELPIPEELSEEQFAEIATVSGVLRDGEGGATVTQIEAEVTNPHAIPGLSDQFRVVRQPVLYRVLGRQVNLGLANYELPPMKVVEIVPHGATPNSPARVVLEPADDDQAVFRLLDGGRP